MKLGGIQSSTCERNLFLFVWSFEKSYIDLDQIRSMYDFSNDQTNRYKFILHFFYIFTFLFLFLYHWIFLEAYPEFSETLNSNKLNAATLYGLSSH